MAGNELSPGTGGLPAASPGDQTAQPPKARRALAGSSGAHAHYLSAEARAALHFQKAKQAEEQMEAVAGALEKLSALGDTVSFDDIVDAAGDIVASGVPAVTVAGMLAELPEQPGQLQAWVQEKAKRLPEQMAQVQQALQVTGNALGKAALQSIIAHSAEEQHQKKLASALAELPAQGSA